MNLPVFEFIEPQRIKLLEDYQLPDNRYIPKGFEYDLGSIPFLLQWFLKPTDIKYSSIIHDFDWLMADFGHYSYHKANISFYKNSIHLDNINTVKALVCFIVLEIIRLSTKVPTSRNYRPFLKIRQGVL